MEQYRKAIPSSSAGVKSVNITYLLGERVSGRKGTVESQLWRELGQSALKPA